MSDEPWAMSDERFTLLLCYFVPLCLCAFVTLWLCDSVTLSLPNFLSLYKPYRHGIIFLDNADHRHHSCIHDHWAGDTCSLVPDLILTETEKQLQESRRTFIKRLVRIKEDNNSPEVASLRKDCPFPGANPACQHGNAFTKTGDECPGTSDDTDPDNKGGIRL